MTIYELSLRLEKFANSRGNLTMETKMDPEF